MKRKDGERKTGLGFLGAVAALVLSGLAGAAWAGEKKAEDSGELWTHTYIVPPTFLDYIEEMAEDQEQALRRREGLRKGLQQSGVKFPEGAAVVYNPGTSTLIVRNTFDQMAIVEALIDSMKNERQLQIFLNIVEMRFNPGELRREIGDGKGMDWLFWSPPPPTGESLPKGSTSAAVASSVEDLLEVMSRPPVPPAPPPTRPAERGVAGVFTDPQYQMVFRALSRMKEIDLLKAPSIVVRSGQAGLSQVDKKRWGVVPVIGPDDLTIDLALYFPAEGETLYRENAKVRRPSAQVTIWDGQTVAYRDRVNEDAVRVVFVTAKLVDPAGIEIEKEDQPEKNTGNPKAAPVALRPAAQIEKEREAIRAADRIALRGYDKLVAGDFKGAVTDFAEALGKLPKDLKDETRRNAFQVQLKKARAGLATLEGKAKGKGR